MKDEKGRSEQGITRRHALGKIATAGTATALGAFTSAEAQSGAVPQGNAAASTKGAGLRVEAVVKTVKGRIRGVQDQDIVYFKGIRYGRVTERFKPASPAPSWEGLYDATEYGPSAVQPPCPEQMTFEQARETFKSLSSVFGVPAIHHDQSEDPLVLNIWTTGLNEKKRPVMFRIHGGGFVVGSGNWSWHDGTNLARRGDVVVVTVNHRLGLLGYLYLGGLSKEYAIGNVGMSDLVLALKWIRENIEAFGGDPDNVTIFGESGGGMKVSTLLSMPSAKGLFHKAIIQSGAALQVMPAEMGTAQARAVLAHLKVDDPAKLASVPRSALVDAQMTVGGGMMGSFPIVDGESLPAHPGEALAKGLSADVPLMLGTCLTEGTLLRFMDPSKNPIPKIRALDMDGLDKLVSRYFGKRGPSILEAYRQMWPNAAPWELMLLIESGAGFRRGHIAFAEAKLQKASTPVFMYLLEWKSGAYGGWVQASHGMDVPLTMDNVQRSGAWTADYPKSQIVADQMSEAWIAFARSGNPRHSGIPAWPTYDMQQRATMSFDVTSDVKMNPYREADIWRDMPQSMFILFDV